MNITQAFVLAAGLGTRMGKMTKTVPKPLLKLGGKAMIDYVIEALSDYGCAQIVVNIHAHAEQMREHFRNHHASVLISDESQQCLGTGGALTYAYNKSLLAQAPFFTHNCDAIFPSPLAERRQILQDLALAFIPARMDGLLLLKKCEDHLGDFALTRDQEIHYGTGYLYTGVQILSPTALQSLPPHLQQGVLEMEQIWQPLIAQKRLYGLVLTHDWLHTGTQDEFNHAMKIFSSPLSDIQ